MFCMVTIERLLEVLAFLEENFYLLLPCFLLYFGLSDISNTLERFKTF